jgi:hypothetical protein
LLIASAIIGAVLLLGIILWPHLLVLGASGEATWLASSAPGSESILRYSGPTASTGPVLYLPALYQVAGSTGQDSAIVAVQNVGNAPTIARLDIWGSYTGLCPPQSATRGQYECSGLLLPGGTWYWTSSLLPSWSRSGIVYAVSACSGSSVVQTNTPLAVTVLRTSSGAPMSDGDISSAYTALAATDLGWPDGGGSYRYAVSLAYGDSGGFNTTLIIQNAGTACTSVNLTLLPDGTCANPVTTSIATLAPTEAYRLDLSTVIRNFRGRVLLDSRQPLAIIADTVGPNALTSQAAVPLDGPGPGQTAGALVAYAPLIYRENQGFDTAVTVQNLSAAATTRVTVEFLDANGGVLETRTAEALCPRGSITFDRPLTNNMPGAKTGWVQIRSTTANVAGLVTLRKYESTAHDYILEALSYPTLPESRVAGVSRVFLPAGAHERSSLGLSSEIALVNFNRTPGVTRFRIDLFAHTQAPRSLYYTLAGGQMTYVVVDYQGLVDPGFQGGAIVEAESTTQGGFIFGAVSVIRHYSVLGIDIPGDETATVTGLPDPGTFVPVALQDCPAVAPPWLGGAATRVFIPGWRIGNSDAGGKVHLQIQNVGNAATIARLDLYGAYTGFCEPQSPGRGQFLCSGLLQPGASWTWTSNDLPTWARSAIVYSMDACTSDGNPTSSVPLSAVVSRLEPALSDPAHSMAAAYLGVTPADLGQFGPGCSFEYELASVYYSGDRNTWLLIQNAGDRCTTVQLRFRQRDDCLRSLIDNVVTLAPGESVPLNVATVIGPGFDGSAQLIASQPLAVVAYTLGNDVLDATTAQPAPSPGLNFQPYRTTVYGPLFYRETNGWESRAYVFNLDPRRTAIVRAAFFDANGAVITSQTAPICPMGMQRLTLSPAGSQAGRAAGAIRVTAEGASPPPIAAVAELTEYPGPPWDSPRRRLVYNFSTATQVDSVERIALSRLTKAYHDPSQPAGTTWTSEIVITNWNTATGTTNLTLDLIGSPNYTLNKSLGPGQTLRINLADEGAVVNGWIGSAILRTSGTSQSSGPSLSAVVTDFGSGFLGNKPAQVAEGRPLDPAPPIPIPTPTPPPTPIPSPVTVAGSRAYIPALRIIGSQATDVGGWIEVQNVGSRSTYAVVTYWGTGGNCSTPWQSSSTSDLLPPGASWRWTTANLPSWARSARVEAYTDTPPNGGHPADVPLAVAVGRSAPSPIEGTLRPLSTGYIAVPPSGLGVPNSDGHYEVVVPGISSGSNKKTWLSIQNAGDTCADVTLEFREQDNCLPYTTCQVRGLAPGEARVYDAGSCVSASFVGSVLLLSPQPLAVVVDSVAGDVAGSRVAVPANFSSAGFAPNTTTAYGTISFAAENGWDTLVYVQNLDPRRIGQTSVSYKDSAGVILEGLNEVICPQGNQTFFQPLINTLPGERLGAVQVQSDGPDPVPIAAAAQVIQYEGPMRDGGLRLLDYSLVSSRLISGTDAIALPWLAYRFSDQALPIKAALTSQVAVANWNLTPGVTEVALDLMTGGRVVKTINRTLGAGQVVGINLADEGGLSPGWRGSGILRLARTTQLGGMRLSAAVADRTDQPEPGPVAVYEGVPLFGSFGPTPTPVPPSMTPSPTPTKTYSPTPTPTASWTNTPVSPTPTATSTWTNTPIPTRTNTPTPVPTDRTTPPGSVFLPLIRRDLTPTSTPTLTPTPICDGGFETGRFEPCWQQGGELARRVVERLDTNEPAYAGTFSALLGQPELGDGASGNIPAGSAWIEQVVHVPDTPQPRLTFWYRVISYDVSVGSQGQVWDTLDVSIDQALVFRDDRGEARPPGSQGERYDTGWRWGEVELSPWRGQAVVVRFAAWNREYDGNGLDYYNTWAYLDQVVVEP